jgi:hypothetical protein
MRLRPPLQAVPVTLLVNGHEIRLLEDGSQYAAWSFREPHADGAGMILQRFEGRLREADAEEADKIIAVLFAKNERGILWASLLMVAAERPGIYADRLWELATNEKMQLSQSVRTDAIAAVAAFYPYRTVDERGTFELAVFHYGADDALHKIEHERWLAGLFQAIGADQLVTEEARYFLSSEGDRSRSQTNIGGRKSRFRLSHNGMFLRRAASISRSRSTMSCKQSQNR